MQLVYSPINAAWMIVLGQQLIAIDDQRFWTEREDAVRSLGHKGLVADKKGHITSVNPVPQDA